MIASRSPNAIVAPKLATLVARRIEQQVVASGWPIGEVLGSESELIDRYGVSRAVLREAVRIVEHNGVARMRGGRGGGLIVAEPNTEAVNAAISVWFSYIGVAASEMYDAHLVMTAAAMRRGAELRDRVAVTALRTEIDAMAGAPDLGRTAFLGLAGKFLALTDNPAVVLFANALSGLLNSPLRGAQSRLIPRMSVDQARAHLDEYAQLADAIDSGDTDGAEHLTSVLFATARRWVSDEPRRPRRGPASIDAAAPKLAARLAVAMRDDIEAAGWPVDTLFGTEADLLVRYGVGRPILREAVRILEHHDALRTKRGPLGGVFVAAPDRAAIVHATGMALAYTHVTIRQLVEVRAAVDLAAAPLAAQRSGPETSAALQAAIAAEQRADDVAIHSYTVHQLIADASGCRPLSLIIAVISELLGQSMRPDVPADDLHVAVAQSRRAHVRVVEAILAGDPDAAERRMRRHVRATLDGLP